MVVSGFEVATTYSRHLVLLLEDLPVIYYQFIFDRQNF